jgi:hypothetical protein
MAVMMRVGRHKAFLRRGEWRCASLDLERELNRFTRTWVQRDAPSEELKRELENSIAEAASRKFGGKLLLRTGTAKQSSQGHLLSAATA